MNSKRNLVIMDRIHDYDVKLSFPGKKEEKKHYKFLNLIAKSVEEATQKIKEKGIKGDNSRIKEIIIDQWSRYRLCKICLGRRKIRSTHNGIDMIDCKCMDLKVMIE